MKRIWKFALTLNPDAEQIIHMPQNATILCVQMQNGVPHVWAMIDDSQITVIVKRGIRLCWTGKMIDEPSGNYIGTFQTLAGEFVWHVFDRGEKIISEPSGV